MPNPHWQQDQCVSCHAKTPDKKSLHLKSKSSEKLCNSCHDSISQHSYIHPTGMHVDKEMVARMPASFRNAIRSEKGRLGCVTCHDLTKTCLVQKRGERLTNPKFFRNGPYKTRTDICYLCHDEKRYQRLNPHQQMTAGKIRKESCLVCHKNGDKLDTAKSISDVDFNVGGNLSSMCTGCHPYQPHPGGSFSFTGKGQPNHLVKPPKNIARRMTTMAKRNGIVLPLAPGTGEVFCGTCHNPHQRGVIRIAAAAKGAGSKNRLRMQKMCANCHDK